LKALLLWTMVLNFGPMLGCGPFEVAPVVRQPHGASDERRGFWTSFSVL
jgi:hypothetical protein